MLSESRPLRALSTGQSRVNFTRTDVRIVQEEFMTITREKNFLVLSPWCQPGKNKTLGTEQSLTVNISKSKSM